MKPNISIFHSTIFEGSALSELRREFSQLGETSYFPTLLESPAHLKELAADSEILVSNAIPISLDDLKDLPKLRMISLLGSGYDAIDLGAMRQAGITVTNAPKYGIENAIDNICSQIKAFATANGDKDKYNVTVTVAAVRAVYHFILKSESSSFHEFTAEFPELRKNFKGLIDSHYSEDIFRSDKAKRDYLPPDLLPFD